MNDIVIYYPLKYWMSRLKHFKLWWKRSKLFRNRNRFKIEDWKEVLGITEPLVTKDCQRLLKYIGWCFAINPSKIYPEDRLDSELKLPDQFLHEGMLGELFEAFEGLVLERYDENRFSEVIFDPRNCTIRELIQNVLLLANPDNESLKKGANAKVAV